MTKPNGGTMKEKLIEAAIEAVHSTITDRDAELIVDAILSVIRAEMPGEKVINSNIPVEQCALNMSWNKYRETFLKILGE